VKHSKIYSIIFYISIISVFIYFIKSDYLSFSGLSFNISFILSLVFLTAGFFIYPLILKQVIKYQNDESSYRSCFLALGSTIFSKYIPGKVAMIYAIAFKLNKNSDSAGIARLSYYVTLFQIFIIVSGLLTGLFFVIQLQELPVYWKIGSAITIITVLFLFQSKLFFRYISKYISSTLKKDISLSHFKKINAFKIILTSILFWILWGIGIYFLINSLGLNINHQIDLVFLFPFSICIGILAVIAPGGIGVREGIFAGFIILLGNPASTAAEISVLSRVWFVTGEIIFFSISSVLPYICKQFRKSNE